MTRSKLWLRRLRVGLAALALAGPGCMSGLHPLPDPRPELAAYCKALPQECRSHVYVFLVHGLDPLDYANLAGVREHLLSLGFIKTYYGQLYHPPYFAREIRRIHEEDPHARFALVGFSFGANMVRDLARWAGEDGIPIDLLVYLDANTFRNLPENRPDNAIRVVNVLARGLIWRGDSLDDADNIQYPDAGHFDTPTHPRTLEALDNELAALASLVPVIERAVPHPLEEGPAPHPAPAANPGPRDEWDFLKPALSFELKPTESKHEH